MSTRQERAELRRLADELAKPREACSIGGPAYGQHPCMKVPCWAVDAARSAVLALLDEVERLEWDRAARCAVHATRVAEAAPAVVTAEEVKEAFREGPQEVAALVAERTAAAVAAARREEKVLLDKRVQQMWYCRLCNERVANVSVADGPPLCMECYETINATVLAGAADRTATLSAAVAAARAEERERAAAMADAAERSWRRDAEHARERGENDSARTADAAAELAEAESRCAEAVERARAEERARFRHSTPDPHGVDGCYCLVCEAVRRTAALVATQTAAAVEAARAEEREACARIVETCQGLVWEVAAAIRARGEARPAPPSEPPDRDAIVRALRDSAERPYTLSRDPAARALRAALDALDAADKETP